MTAALAQPKKSYENGPIVHDCFYWKRQTCLSNHRDPPKSNLQVLPRAFSSQPRHLYTAPTNPPSEGFLTCSWFMSSNCPSPFYLQPPTRWTISLRNPQFWTGERTLLAIVQSFLSAFLLGWHPWTPFKQFQVFIHGPGQPLLSVSTHSRWCHLLSPVSHWFPILQLQFSSTPFIL